MKPDLQVAVNQWRAPSPLGEARSYTEQQSHAAHGEVIIKLSMTLDVTVAGRTKHIVHTAVFHTVENSSPEPNSNGDCYRFARKAVRLNEGFAEQFDEAVDELTIAAYGRDALSE